MRSALLPSHKIEVSLASNTERADFENFLSMWSCAESRLLLATEAFHYMKKRGGEALISFRNFKEYGKSHTGKITLLILTMCTSMCLPSVCVGVWEWVTHIKLLILWPGIFSRLKLLSFHEPVPTVTPDSASFLFFSSWFFFFFF